MRRYLNRYEKIKSCFCSYRPFFFYLWTFKTNVSLPESSWFWPLTEGVTVWGAGSALPTTVLKKKIKKNLEHNPVYPVFCENGSYVSFSLHQIFLQMKLFYQKQMIPDNYLQKIIIFVCQIFATYQWPRKVKKKMQK